MTLSIDWPTNLLSTLDRRKGGRQTRRFKVPIEWHEHVLAQMRQDNLPWNRKKPQDIALARTPTDPWTYAW